MVHLGFLVHKKIGGLILPTLSQDYVCDLEQVLIIAGAYLINDELPVNLKSVVLITCPPSYLYDALRRSESMALKARGAQYQYKLSKKFMQHTRADSFGLNRTFSGLLTWYNGIVK